MREFSRARTGPPGPAPLRSASHLHGLPKDELRPAEFEQVRLGADFAIQSARIATVAHRVGAGFAIENPAPAGPVSLFHLPEYLTLAALPGVRHAEFDQCRYGAQSAKPTRILYSGIDLSNMDGRTCDHPRVWAEWKGRRGELCSGYRAHRPLVGKGPGGQYLTKAAAAYPGPLCRALAWAVILGGARRPPAASS